MTFFYKRHGNSEFQTTADLYHSILAFFLGATVNNTDNNGSATTLSTAYINATNGNCQSAIQLTANLDSVESQLLKANCYRILGESEEEATVYQALYEKYYASPVIALNLLMALYNSEQTEEAKELIQTLKNPLKTNPILHMVRGFIGFEEGQFESAAADLTYAIQNGLSGEKQRVYAAISYATTNQLEQAYNILQPLKEPTGWPANVARLATSLELALGYKESAANSVLQINNIQDSDLSLLIQSSIASRENPALEAKINAVLKESIKTAEQKVVTGILLMHENATEAVKMIEEGVSAGSDSIFGRISLIQHYVESGNHAQALKIADEMIESDHINGSYRSGLVSKISILLETGAYQQAAELLESTIAESPNDLTFKLQQARLQLETNQTQSAEESLIELSKNPDFTEKVLITAYNYSFKLSAKFQSDLLDAIESFKNSKPLVRLYIAGHHLQNERVEQAYKVLNTAPMNNEILPDNYWVTWLDTARVVAGVERELDIANQWLSQQPDSQMATIYKLYALREVSSSSESIDFARESINKFKNNQLVKLLAANLYLMNQNYSETERLLSSVSDEARSLPLAKRIKAMLFFYQKQFKKALPMLESAYSDSQNNLLARMIFISNMSLKKDDDARSFMQKHLNVSPGDLQSTLLFANTLLNPSPSEAIIMYKRALDMAPENVVAANNLGWLLIQEKSYDEAQSVLEKAIDIHSDVAPLYETMAQLYEAKGDKVLAEAYLMQAIKHAPGNQKYREKLRNL